MRINFRYAAAVGILGAAFGVIAPTAAYASTAASTVSAQKTAAEGLACGSHCRPPSHRLCHSHCIGRVTAVIVNHSIVITHPTINNIVVVRHTVIVNRSVTVISHNKVIAHNKVIGHNRPGDPQKPWQPKQDPEPYVSVHAPWAANPGGPEIPAHNGLPGSYLGGMS